MCCLVEPEWEIENIEGPDSVTRVLKVLEPDARKPARPVLRGGSHGNVTFLPDRRLSKIIFRRTTNGWKETSRESYLYHGQNEIGAFNSHDEPKNLRVLGIARYKDNPATIGIELEGQPFAPILDVQGNIRRLVDLETGTITNRADFTAFGEQLQTSSQDDLFNPWHFASKRFDPELGFIYFGKRYYDPLFGRWLTIDPAGFIDSTNLYQYVFNNPFLYRDPDGQFAFAIPLLIWGAELVIPSLSAYAGYAITGALAVAVAYGGYKAVQTINARDHQKYSIENQVSTTDAGYSSTMQRKKKGGVDETLSDDPLNDPNLEDISHPEAKGQGRHKFRDKQTGEIIEYDEAQPGKTGHKGHEHYHRPNPNSTGKGDYYLDSNGNPVPKGSEPSHLYPPEWVWWE